MTRLRKRIVGAAAALLATAMLSAPVTAQEQVGLVNVNVSDIETGDILSHNKVNLAVAANIAATVCGVAVPVNVLAVQVFRFGGFSCPSAIEEGQVLEVFQF